MPIPRIAPLVGAITLVATSLIGISVAARVGPSTAPVLSPVHEWNDVSIYPPAIVSVAEGRYDVFYVDPNHALQRVRSTDGGAHWTEPQSLGSYLTSGPAAASWGAGRLDVFARGPKGTLIHATSDGSDGATFTAWEDLGHPVNEAPAAAAWGEGRLDVFYPGGDRTLRHVTFDHGWLPGEENLGGTCTSAPSATSWAKGRIDVVVRNAEYGVSRITYEDRAGAWTAWGAVGAAGSVVAAPAIRASAVGALDLFWMEPDTSVTNELRHRHFGDGAWKAADSVGAFEIQSVSVAASGGRGAGDLLLSSPSVGMRYAQCDLP